MSVLVGKRAPVFWAPAVVNGSEIVENFSLDDYLGKKYVVFFFIPQISPLYVPRNFTLFNRS